MSQNICNICGANYEYHNGRWKCPACGAFKAEELSNEEVTLLYNAAQKLRLSDFDEAEKAYADIIEKFPKNPDGYWGRLLSRYGIKYEEDFDGRKIPTCYATSIESVITDKDYLKAIELADQETKAYYTLQAEYIERVRKEWVEKARKEKPYDIFICYKDSDLANGIDRTQDSIAAQELYIHLIEQGYRVFFSRESLRGKVGEKYEPYIFNALSTAKVMLVYGSKSEYITSTWLKNEWTRYEKRLQAGEKKPNSLIVACDGFSPTELPKVLSSMQCFDATSRSFYTDLDAVLKKIIKGEEKPKPVVEPKPEKKKSKKLPIAIASIAALIAIFLCILLPNVLGDKPFATVTDSKYGVVISADSEIFDKNTSVIVDKLTDGAQYASLVSVVNTSKTIDIQNAIIYDIECDVDITKSVTIKVAYTKSDADSTVKVYYVSDDKTTIEEHSCIYDDGYVQFKTTHLSYYVIGEVAKATTPGGNENPGGDDPKPPVTPSLTYEDGVLQVGVSANYEPYEYLDNGQFKGIEIDILKAIATELGLEIRFENDTFEDLLGNLNAKEVDCIIGVTETAQRNELATATNALFSEDDMEFIIYLNKDCNDLRTAINTAITKLKNNGTIDGIIENYNTPELPTTTTIIFNANGGSGTMTNQSITFNSADNLKKCEFNREGYNFIGWATTSDGVAVYDDEATLSVQSQESITLYAVWEEIIIPESVKVEFDANGGLGSAQSITTSQNSTFTFPNCNYTKEGYRFVGWVTDTNSNDKYSAGSQGTVGTTTLVKYYAKWEAISYTATFKNGNAIIKEVPFTIETTSIAEPSVPARQCYSGKWSNYEIIANDITIYAEYTLAHSNIVKVDAKEAQCNATGNIEYWHCSGCNTNYTTQEGTSEATNVTLSKVACEYVNGSCKWCGSSGSPIEDFTFEDAGDYTYILKSYIGDDTTVVIPAMYQGKPITAIADNAFKNCIAVESVSLSNNITSIGANAFENCTALTNIVFSNKLTTIGEYAFSGCSNLITISIPQTVVTIGSAAFKNCAKLDNITIPSGVQKLQYQVFYGCSSLETLTISEGVSEIEAYTFQNCSSLKRVIIPQSVTTISPDGIFSGCSSLETLVIPIGQVSYKLLSGKNYISALPCLFGTIEYEDAFVYECVPKYYTTNNYGMGYWEDDYWSKRVCYVPNSLKEIYIGTTESMGLSFFQNIDAIDIYWNYVYNGVKVDFDYNDGTTESIYKFVESGETYTFDIPTRTGYTFDGWYYNGTKITGANGVTINSWNINSDCTLTAKWTIVSYSIGIELNGGSLSTTKNSYTVETDTFTIGEPTKTGYEFLGWSGSDISGNPKTITITKGSIGSKSYTANWRAKTYTISLNANGGTVSQNSKAVEYNANLTFPVPTKQGYTFVGWYYNTTKITNNKGETISAWNIDSACTLKAEWSANTNTKYTVNHYFEDANTSNYTLQSETLYGTTGASITPTVQSRPYFSSPTAQTTTIAADGTTVVNYYYTRESFTVSFVTNGGNSVTSQTCKYEQTLSSLPTPVRTGYTFGGWFTDVAQTNSVTSASIQSNLTVYAWWEEETKASEFNYSSVGDGYTVTKFIGSSTTVCIPSFIGDVPVISISAQAFNNDNGYTIQELTIQEGIQTIGYYAFGYCDFESVQLPQSLTSIGSYAFFHCQELTSVTIPGSVESIGTYAFEQCTKLATVILNNGVKTIEKNAFASCSALTNVTLPDSLTTIGEAAFSYCGITTLTIPQGVTSIGNKAFEGCSKILEIHFNAVAMNDLNPSNAVFAYIGTATDGISVTIGNKVTKVPSYLFYPGATSYPNITSLTFDSTSVCESIGMYAFAESMGLDTLEIPNSVTTIGNFAFYCTQQYSGDRSGIKTLVLGEGVKTIGNDSFGGLSYLTSLTINSVSLDDFSNSNLVFNKAGISGTGVSVVFGNKVERVPAYIFGSGTYNYHPKIISVSFASGSKCTSIGERAFYGSTDFVEIQIPESVSSIDELAFYHCNKLEAVRITNIKKWCEITFHSDTCILENANTKLMLNGSLVSDLKDYTEITSIANYAFKGYDYFVDLTIPSNVATVGTASFAYCQAVTKLTLPNKLTTIGENAFLSMLYLSSITIPNSVEVIETQGFASCGLTTVIFENGSKLTTIGESAFTGNKLESVTVPASVTTIGDYAFAYNTSLEQIRCEVVEKPAGWSTYWNANKIMTEMYAGYYDIVWFCNGDIWDGTATYSFAGGTGTEKDPYLISTAEQLAYVATAVNQGVDTFSGKYLKLTQDLHLMNREWSPIGNDSYSFEGIFDGGNCTILGLKVTDNTLTYAGLFGKAANSTIQNLIISEANIETTSVKYVGLLGGSLGVINNVSVQGSIKAYSIKYSGDVGGVAGNATSISQCSANVTVYASLKDDQTAGTHPTIYAGGIAGSCSNISNSYSEGSVDAGGGNLYSHDAYVGGIVGSGGTITNCYSNAVAKASGMRNSYAGGIAASAGTITNCVVFADVSTYTYSLNGTYGGAYIGRVIGKVDEGDTITGNYVNSTQTCTRKTSSSSVTTTTNDYGTLQFTQTLQSENFIYNTLGWSSDIWQINEGGFPTLK